jgi:hypothetical protein
MPDFIDPFLSQTLRSWRSTGSRATPWPGDPTPDLEIKLRSPRTRKWGREKQMTVRPKAKPPACSWQTGGSGPSGSMGAHRLKAWRLALSPDPAAAGRSAGSGAACAAP